MTEKAEKILKELKKRDKKSLKNSIPKHQPGDLEFMNSKVPEPIHDNLNRMPAEPVDE